MYLKLLSFCVGVFIFCSYSNPRETSILYIQEYANIAVEEMNRSGIPASIILAQGLLESNFGSSSLATEANNHFGIKCKSTWTGQTYYHKDDDYNGEGKLIESCFRVYSTAIDSYVDHSNFLLEGDRYLELFYLPKLDYLKWAHGLKRCGYATDPDYAIKLIKKIEQYKLYEFDYISQ